MKVTPQKKTPKQTGSLGKMKQLSLMSFFKPAKTTSSSPLKSRSNIDSDKENDVSMVETDTPLTSETNEITNMGVKAGIDSSPVKARVDADLPPQTQMNTVKEEKKHEEKKITEATEKRAERKPKAETLSPAALQKAIAATEDAPKSVADGALSDASEGASPAVSRRKSTKNGHRAKRSVSYAESDDSDMDEGLPVTRKRKVVESDDEDDFKPASGDEDEHMSDFVAESEEEPETPEENSDEDVLEDEKPPKRRKTLPKPAQAPAPLVLTSLGTKFMAGSSYVSTGKKTETKAATKPKAKKSFEKENEERYQWLVNIRDGEKRSPEDPEYDPRTLYVPPSAWTKFTAFEKQYWDIKAKMWDTVVFFKKGKFYELYENDAKIANSEFDLKIAGGGRANMMLAGIPEMSFEYWAKEFISHGYKVAKVDQVETLLAKEMRGGSTKEEKIIKRELTGVLTGGTLTNLDMLSDDMATYCMAIKESSNENGERVFGACFVDTATSEMNLIELVDDDECSKLDTLITQTRPKEILCEKNNLCLTAVKIIKFSAHNTHQIWNHLNPLSEFWDYDTAVENLVQAKYYECSDLDDFSNYPPALLAAKDKYQVAFNAFGGLLYYLRTLKLDSAVMSLGNIHQYNISRGSSHMLLDGITLTNLEVLHNNFDGGDRGTLLKLVNRAITPFGKRMLKNWVLHPLMDIDDINARQDAVEFLMNEEPELRVQVESMVQALPDLERLIARVHSGTLPFKDFLRVIEGFERISALFKKLSAHDLAKSGALNKYVARFPLELHNLILSWEDAFDRQKALENVVAPAAGVDDEFDKSTEVLLSLETELNQHLRDYKKQFKSHEICFRDSGKELYLIEVPIKIKSIPSDWQQMGATSKVKRYWSPEVKKLVRELMEQKETHKAVCEQLISRMYLRFDVNYTTWLAVIAAVASIDCLIALTKASETMAYPACRPSFEVSASGFVLFSELRHPCFLGTGTFIPNDIHLGEQHARFGLLTGANAAGKSTLMRTTALAVILAQLGCYVPAALARLSPCDKIMTRLGANDNIMQGKSTFFVELSETKKMLANATSHSLVIIDELGRGGSSSDGYAIAEAVLHHLATHVQPVGFFATHYGSLGSSFVNHPQIRPLRMGIVVDHTSRNITFLYKVEEGSAPGSFGMNVAAMCGIPSGIVDNAEVAAKNYEQTLQLKNFVEKVPLGMQSDFAWCYGKYDSLKHDMLKYDEDARQHALTTVFSNVDALE